MAVDSLETEIDTAVRVVHLASSLCVKVQEKLHLPNGGHVKSKDDDSPVTVAGSKSLFFLIVFCFFRLLQFRDLFGF